MISYINLLFKFNHIFFVRKSDRTPNTNLPEFRAFQIRLCPNTPPDILADIKTTCIMNKSADREQSRTQSNKMKSKNNSCLLFLNHIWHHHSSSLIIQFDKDVGHFNSRTELIVVIQLIVCCHNVTKPGHKNVY